MSTENSLERMRQEHERVSTLYEQSQSQIAETKILSNYPDKSAISQCHITFLTAIYMFLDVSSII